MQYTHNEAYALLLRCQRFVGRETSAEEKEPHTTTDIYRVPLSKGETLRNQAVEADLRDILIKDLRDLINDFEWEAE